MNDFDRAIATNELENLNKIDYGLRTIRQEISLIADIADALEFTGNTGLSAKLSDIAYQLQLSHDSIQKGTSGMVNDSYTAAINASNAMIATALNVFKLNESDALIDTDQ